MKPWAWLDVGSFKVEFKPVPPPRLTFYLGSTPDGDCRECGYHVCACPKAPPGWVECEDQVVEGAMREDKRAMVWRHLGLGLFVIGEPNGTDMFYCGTSPDTYGTRGEACLAADRRLDACQHPPPEARDYFVAGDRVICEDAEGFEGTLSVGQVYVVARVGEFDLAGRLYLKGQNPAQCWLPDRFRHDLSD